MSAIYRYRVLFKAPGEDPAVLESHSYKDQWDVLSDAIFSVQCNADKVPILAEIQEYRAELEIGSKEPVTAWETILNLDIAAILTASTNE